MKHRDPKDILEKTVKERVKRVLRNHGAWWHMPVQRGHGASGVDFHVCHNGKFLGIETKRPGKHPTPRQTLTLESIEEAGGVTFVIGEEYYPEEDKFSGESELIAWLLLSP
jgi:mevalonate kinase